MKPLDYGKNKFLDCGHASIPGSRPGEKGIK